MTSLDIVYYGDPILRKKCNSIKKFDELDIIIGQMFDSMYEEEGIGLAANQVGLDMNLFIIDITHTEEEEDTYVFINSEIMGFSGQETEYQEGCLSLPGIALEVIRPENVILKYQTIDQKWHQNEFSGLMSRAIQHEIDHLNGVFIVDRISESEKIKYQNQLRILEDNTKKKIGISTNQNKFIL